MTAQKISSILREISQEGQAFQANNGKSREALLASARSLVATLESPVERFARIVYHEPLIETVIRICIDLKVFNLLVENGGKPQTAAQLAGTAHCDPKLLERFLKHLATGNIVIETAPDEYAPNDITRVLAMETAQGTVLDVYDHCTILSGHFPEFMKKTNYADPVDKDNSLFKFAFNTDQHYFDYIFSPGREEQAAAFSNHMKFKTLEKKWYETVPVDQMFSDFKADDKDAVLLVDIGGDTGFDALNFRKAWPDLPGRIILQDRPDTIATLDKDALKPVEAMGHDFFTPQPVKAAKAYYMKMVLHDWPDESCQKILSNVKAAMQKGYSRILINEIVVAEQGADWFSTSVDILVMMFHSAKERRAKEWRTLIEGVEGLKIVKIWECAGALEKLIEVRLV